MQSNKDTFMHNPFLNPVDYSLFPNIRKDRHSKKKPLRNIRNWHKPGSTDKTCLKRDFSSHLGARPTFMSEMCSKKIINLPAESEMLLP